MKKIVSVFFLIVSLSCIGQDTKGTIRIKKVPIAIQKIDTVRAFDTTIYFSAIYSPPVYSSNGVNYDVPPQFIGATETDRYAQNAQKKFVDGMRVFPDCYKCKGSTVFTDLTMMVNKDGSLTDIKVKKGAKDCALCDEEAMRIVKKMPNWKPAQYNGQDIDLQWETTITFTYLK